MARSLVSKEKRRYTDNGFDLDLTYITERIIAMGFPSEGLEGMYRNPLPEVVRFLETNHADHYMVYNLCSERAYDVSKFQGRVRTFPFDDHNCPPCEMINDFCRDVDAWMSQSPENIAAVHCKAGKGRTGLMICAYLVHFKFYPTARDALKYYGFCRTKNQQGVTIPSQRRYVQYSEVMSNGIPVDFNKNGYLHRIRLVPAPIGLSDDLFFEVRHKGEKIFSSKKLKNGKPRRLAHGMEYCFPEMCLSGDIKITFCEKHAFHSKNKCFWFWFNTGFIRDRYLTIGKAELDKADKDKRCVHYPADFYIELFFDGNQEPPPNAAQLRIPFMADQSVNASNPSVAPEDDDEEDEDTDGADTD